MRSIHSVRAHASTAVVVAVLVTAVLAGAVGTTGGAATPDGGDSAGPTVHVGNATVSPGGTATVPVVLSSAPDGLAGYRLRVSLADGDVADIDGVTYPSDGQLTATPDPTAGSDAVRVKAVDLADEIRPGATDVHLASIRVRGLQPGNASLTVEPVRFDSDSGSNVDVRPRHGQVAVSADSAPSDRGPSPTASEPTTTERAVDTVVLGLAVILVLLGGLLVGQLR